MSYQIVFTDELYHFGILGQKWGIRRYQNDDGTLTEAGKKRYFRQVGSTDKVSLNEKKNLFGKASGSYDILDKKGKKVGETIVDEYGDEYHVDWIGIKEKERRKGYGNDALDLLLKDAYNKGKKYMTLDAAGLDPAAIYLYKKKGFEAVKTIDEDIWNGLVVMRKDL